MTTSVSIGYKPELMDEAQRSAVMAAMQRLYFSEHLQEVWPGLFDLHMAQNNRPPIDEVEIVLLPLDRIGAPAGASGSSVYVAYYSLSKSATSTRPLPSPPLVIKIGKIDKLKGEIEVENKWPTLTLDVRARFALPIILDDNDPNYAILIAPFRSNFKPDASGGRHGVRLADLFGLLNDKDELVKTDEELWTRVRRYVEHALDSIDYVHRGNRAHYLRDKAKYSESYEWYLRDIFKHENKRKMLSHLFGDDAEVLMFNERWPNPNRLAKKIVDSGIEFNGIFGAVHGDLHPKNIVVGENDAVRIIDFGWVSEKQHILVDYLLLDINLRCVTLPSQLSASDIHSIANFLKWDTDVNMAHASLQSRANVIKDVIWKRLENKGLVADWKTEYLVPFFLVAYGLLLYLDSTRNQSALLATVLAAARQIGDLE